MKIKRKILFVLVMVLVGIQLVPPTQNKEIIIPKKDFLMAFNATDTIAILLRISCYDCHSNYTNYPWYSKIQPMRLIMDRHIKKGKRELNFNEFVNYSNRRKKSKLKSIISQLKDYEMPLKSYTLLHKDAKLSEGERKLIIGYINKIQDSLNK